MQQNVDFTQENTTQYFKRQKRYVQYNIGCLTGQVQVFFKTESFMEIQTYDYTKIFSWHQQINQLDTM